MSARRAVNRKKPAPYGAGKLLIWRFNMNKDNSVFLRGRIVKDAELKAGGSGTAVCEFALSVPKGNGKEGAVDLSLLGVAAKGFCPRLLKGRLASVSGRLERAVWENKEGKTFSRLRVVIENIDIDEEPGGEIAAAERAGRDDDIPF
jgi:single-strand DNA-binding protein